MSLSRRKFMTTVAGISAGAAADRLFAAGSQSRILGANDRVRVGIVGFSD